MKISFFFSVPSASWHIVSSELQSVTAVQQSAFVPSTPTFKCFKLDYFNDPFAIKLNECFWNTSFFFMELISWYNARIYQIKILNFKIKFIMFWNAFVLASHIEKRSVSIVYFAVAVHSIHFIRESPPNNVKFQFMLQYKFPSPSHSHSLGRYLFVCASRKNHRGVQTLLNAILSTELFNKCPIICWA